MANFAKLSVRFIHFTRRYMRPSDQLIQRTMQCFDTTHTLIGNMQPQYMIEHKSIGLCVQKFESIVCVSYGMFGTWVDNEIELNPHFYFKTVYSDGAHLYSINFTIHFVNKLNSWIWSKEKRWLIVLVYELVESLVLVFYSMMLVRALLTLCLTVQVPFVINPNFGHREPVDSLSQDKGTSDWWQHL